MLDRDNVGIVTRFSVSVASSSSRRRRSASFCLATTHLLFNPKAGEVKLAQLACLLAELDRLATPPPGKPRLPCIVCGDLNSLPSSPLMGFLERGELDYSQMVREQVAGYFYRGSRQLAIPSPLLPPEVPISQDCRLLSSSEDTPTGATPILSHHFKFTSAYPHPSPSPHPPSSVTTFHRKAFETVDYILFTPGHAHRGAGPEGAGFQLLSRHSPISPQRLRDLGPQPHLLLPSDHLWLLASLQLLPSS